MSHSIVQPGSSAKKILDVGCGQNKYAGAIGIDSNPHSHADVIHDLGVVPYPFADNEFDEIICRHVIEHVPDVMAFVSELHRITKPGRPGPDVYGVCFRTPSDNQARRPDKNRNASLLKPGLADGPNTPQPL